MTTRRIQTCSLDTGESSTVTGALAEVVDGTGSNRCDSGSAGCLGPAWLSADK